MKNGFLNYLIHEELAPRVRIIIMVVVAVVIVAGGVVFSYFTTPTIERWISGLPPVVIFCIIGVLALLWGLVCLYYKLLKRYQEHLKKLSEE